MLNNSRAAARGDFLAFWRGYRLIQDRPSERFRQIWGTPNERNAQSHKKSSSTSREGLSKKERYFVESQGESNGARLRMGEVVVIHSSKAMAQYLAI